MFCTHVWCFETFPKQNPHMCEFHATNTQIMIDSTREGGGRRLPPPIVGAAEGVPACMSRGDCFLIAIITQVSLIPYSTLLRKLKKVRRSSPTHFLIDSLLNSIKKIEESEEELPDTFSY